MNFSGEPIMLIFYHDVHTDLMRQFLFPNGRSMGGEDWVQKDHWLSTDDLSSWFGLTIRSNQVTKLELNSNNVKGR